MKDGCLLIPCETASLRGWRAVVCQQTLLWNAEVGGFLVKKATVRSAKFALSCRKKAQKRATIRYPSAVRKPTKTRVLNPQESKHSPHHQRVCTPCINRQKCFCYVPIHSSTLFASIITPDSYINVKKGTV